MNDGPKQRVMTLIAIALTFGSGAMDVTSFTRLGNVFTSVMTGNIVLWGLAAARGSATLASHSTVAIAGYIAGVAAATWIAHGFTGKADAGKPGDGKPGDGKASDGKAGDGKTGRGKADGAGERRASGQPSHITRPFLAELVLLAGFTVGWEISGARPAGWAQFCLLAVAAAAMGVQSSAVRDMGMTEVSTTFLTGTLTGLVSKLVRPGERTSYASRRLGVLIGLAAGAGLGGLLIATAAAAAPVLPLAAITATLVLAFAPPHWVPPAKVRRGAPPD
jgi:uncharacterized membrane protein YoaK (UPF0700 family)